jgi:hypothetical protein
MDRALRDVSMSAMTSDCTDTSARIANTRWPGAACAATSSRA